MKSTQPHIAVINAGSVKTGQLCVLLFDAGASVTEHSIANLENINPKEYNAFVIGGSPILVTMSPRLAWYKQQLMRLLASDKPFLGVCFGHQLLALCHGARMHVGQAVNGMQPVTVKQANALFDGLSVGNFSQNHCEYVSVPSQFTLLADSPTCSNEAMRHQSLPHYGVQFHPEASDADGVRLLQNFVTIVKQSNEH